MAATTKLLLGLVILLVGLYLFADSALGWNRLPGNIQWWQNFVVVLTGTLPIFLILVGLFILWLEMDEMKANKAFSKTAEPKK